MSAAVSQPTAGLPEVAGAEADRVDWTRVAVDLHRHGCATIGPLLGAAECRSVAAMYDEIFAQCRAALPGWERLSIDDVDFEAPKGFSSITVTIRPRQPAEPPAVFYRRLEGKENAILDAAAERNVFLLLGDAGIAAECLHYGESFRL